MSVLQLCSLLRYCIGCSVLFGEFFGLFSLWFKNNFLESNVKPYRTIERYLKQWKSLWKSIFKKTGRVACTSRAMFSCFKVLKNHLEILLKANSDSIWLGRAWDSVSPKSSQVAPRLLFLPYLVEAISNTYKLFLFKKIEE